MILAVSDPETVPIFAGFAQYGALGLVVLGLGWFSWSAIGRERARSDAAEQRADRAEQRLDDLNASMRTTVIPVLTRTAEATTAVVAVLAEVAARRDGR